MKLCKEMVEAMGGAERYLYYGIKHYFFVFWKRFHWMLAWHGMILGALFCGNAVLPIPNANNSLHFSTAANTIPGSNPIVVKHTISSANLVISF